MALVDPIGWSPYHRVGGRKRPRRDSVLLGTKAGPDMRSGRRGAWPKLFHVGMQSLYLNASISQSSVCTLSVFPTPHHPSPGLDTRGDLARHPGWRLTVKEIDVIAFVRNRTLTFIQQIPSQPRNNSLTHMYMYISTDHAGDRIRKHGLDKRTNPPA